MEQFKSVIFKKHFVISILIFIIPIIVLLLLIDNSLIVFLRNEILHNGENSLEKSIDIIDDRISLLNTIAIDINENDYIISNAKNYNYYTKSQINTVLKKNIYMPYYNDIILYYRGSDDIYSVKDYDTVDNFFDMYYKFDVDKSEINRWLNETQFSELLPVQTVSKYKGEKTDVVLYVVPLLSREPQITVIFVIDNQWFKNQLKDTFINYGGEIYLTNGLNKLVTYYLPDGTFYEKSEILDNLTTDVTKKKYISMIRKAKTNDFAVTALLNEKIMFHSMYSIRFITWSCVIVLLVIGIFLAFIIAINNYKPILNLKAQLGEDDTGNDYKIICGGIERIKRDNEAIYKELKNRENRLRYLILKDIIQSDVNIEENYNMDLFMEDTVNGILILQCVVIIKNVSKNKEDSDLSAILPIISNHEQIWAYEIKNNFEDAFVILMRYPQNLQGFAENILDGLSVNIFEALNKSYLIIKGIETSDIYDIKSSFLSANNIYCAKTSNEKYKYIYPYSDIKKLTSAVEQYKLDEAETILNHIRENILTEQLQPFIRICIIFEIYNIFIKLIKEISLNDDVSVWIQKMIDDQHETKNEDLVYVFHNLTECAKSLLKNKTHKNELVKAVCDYIGNNLNDYRLSVQNLADMFEVSTTYLNQLFRKELQMNVYEYLTSIKMDKVKHMLINSEIPIKTIMESVGYCDASSLGRKFKSMYGVSLSEFRNNNQNNVNK